MHAMLGLRQECGDAVRPTTTVRGFARTIVKLEQRSTAIPVPISNFDYSANLYQVPRLILSFGTRNVCYGKEVRDDA
ncbi:unannotated protein [freshwater metagenome]|uniref:Unannotated protein n=1 Tax=freshwater metagenome TaxID=449393 RepID=A0A6J7CPB7_9ZZZZ